MDDLKALADKELYAICKKWGLAALEARRKFAGLLPEVHRRELVARTNGKSWLKARGFTCLYEFAARLGGMSRDQVNRVLQLDRKYAEMPKLRGALVEGAISVNKLARIASIATIDNQEKLFDRARVLSKAAIDIFVKEYKNGTGEVVPGHRFAQGRIGAPVGRGELGIVVQDDKEREVDSIIMRALSPELKSELWRLIEKGLNINEILMKLLVDRERGIEWKKAKIAQKQSSAAADRAIIGAPAKRYLPVEVRRVIREEFGERCAAPGCGKKAVQIHHVEGFARVGRHDPRFLKPLCQGHHQLAHAGG